MVAAIAKACGKVLLAVGVTITAKIISDKIEKKCLTDAQVCRYMPVQEREACPKRYEVMHLEDTDFKVE